MAKITLRPAIFYLFSLVLLLCAAPDAFGRGGRDADLNRADELIRELRYEEAILILTDYARRRPERFDEAQRRLRRIYQIRDEFNRTADELIITLLNDPENDEKIVRLSRHLYSLEHEGSPILANFVSNTREIAQFNINRNLLRRILEQGRIDLDNGESLAALRTYAQGMDFMREEFYLAKFGEQIENQVNRETENINNLIESFRQVSSQLGAICSELNRTLLAGETAGINEIIGRLSPAMDRFAELKHVLFTSVNLFDVILDEIRSVDTEMGDRNHLAFLSVLILGRTGESIQEGMLGAFDTYWKNSVVSVVQTITALIERANARAITAVNVRNYPQVFESLHNMDFYVSLIPLFFDKHRQLFESTRQQTASLYGRTVLTQDIPSFLEIRALNEANNFLLQAADVAMRHNIDTTTLTRFMNGNINASMALNLEQQNRNSIVDMRGNLAEIVTRADEVHIDINQFHAIMHVYETARVIERMNGFYLSEERQSVQRYYAIAQANFANSLAERRARFERSQRLLNGERSTTEEGVIYYYPTEALAELTALLAASAADIENANTILRQSGDEGQLSEVPDIAELRANYLASINELREMRTLATALTENARVRSNQAVSYRNEGDRLFRDAQAALQRRDFSTARDRIVTASNRYSQSLALQESAALRTLRDTQLIALGSAIDNAENELIIAEVRVLIDSARTDYFNGNFPRAEDSLVRARNRWSVTNIEENEEVIHWLSIVRTALAATSGRIIPPTAPLYPEMSQLLNQAQRNFEEGVRLLNTGMREQGIGRFDEARQLTREIRLMFPINQEAGILDLRIEQFLDPAAFNAAFEQRLRAAIAGVEQRRSMEAFADLLNLAEINPRYPNMRNIIISAEISIGIRPPPTNPADVALARELTASAQRILDSNNNAQFPTALAQLDQAIRLHPENQDAPRVRDRVLNRMSVPGTIVLSSQDEAEYQRALRELQGGNNLAAFTIVERLMQNPRNRNVTKLIELQQRIRVLL